MSGLMRVRIVRIVLVVRVKVVVRVSRGCTESVGIAVGALRHRSAGICADIDDVLQVDLGAYRSVNRYGWINLLNMPSRG